MITKFKNIKYPLARVLVYFISSLYKAKNRLLLSDKKRLLLFTDSRGTGVDRLLKQRNPYYSYLEHLKPYNVTYKFCPRKFTSILDFLEFHECDINYYDSIVLHCGIVDFAPRPVSSYEKMLDSKMKYIKEKGWINYFKDRSDFLPEYEGEKTIRFMPKDLLMNEIIPILKNTNGLIYIGINPVLDDWDGNYWRKRPSCINHQLELDKLVHDKLFNTIDLSTWDDKEVKSRTVDNVHYNKLGLDYIGAKLKSKLDS